MIEKKLHLELTDLDMDTRYNMGYFDIDFTDGNLVFQVFGTPCQTAGCRCDHLRFELITEGTKLTAWYTREREWQDENHQPAHEELLQVLQIIEKTDMFQERYLHLAYLRRKYVLAQQHRLGDPFQVSMPQKLITDPGPFLGKVALAVGGKERAYPWELSFCANPNCFCFNINLAVFIGEEEWSFWVDEEDQITAHDPNFSPNQLAKVRQRFKKNSRFWELIKEFRSERELENYHRFVKQYPKQVADSM